MKPISKNRSSSSMRADQVEAELAILREKLQAMKASEKIIAAHAIHPKSASATRADAAEAKLARQCGLLRPKPTKKYLKFSCKFGWCRHGGDCTSAYEDGLQVLMNKVELMEKDLKQMQDFSELRSEMERLIARVGTQIQQKIAKANQLDLVIVMDCTESMKPWIGKAKAAIVSIIDNIKRDHPRANVRVGFVAYRDFSDGEKRLQIQTLTTDVQVVREFIGSLSAFGGGDAPEDIPGGLAAAMEMPFKADAKCIVLVADYPCHGSKFHDLSDDMTYQRQIEHSPDICAQMRELVKRGIDFTFIEVDPAQTLKMTQILQKEFNGVESCDGFGREFQKVSLSNAHDAVHFASTVHCSASSSLQASKERSVTESLKVFGAPKSSKNGGIGRPLSHVVEGDEEENEVALVPPLRVKTLHNVCFSQSGEADK